MKQCTKPSFTVGKSTVHQMHMFYCLFTNSNIQIRKFTHSLLIGDVIVQEVSSLIIQYKYN